MRLIKFLAIILVLVIAAIIAGLITPLSAKPDGADVRAAAAAYESRIIRDEWGVAHIFGPTDPDTSFGLGYSHAEDDWKTIQQVVLSSRGDSALHFGPSVAPSDYLYDLFRVEAAVESKIGTDIRPDTRAMAKAYADGLNLYALENPDQTLPGLLPVTDKDVIAGFTWATPFFYRMDDTIKALFEAEDSPQVSPWRKMTQPNLPAAVRGSNAFAMAPSRSSDGHTRLILNSHQPFTGPYAWFEAHVVSESGYNVAGAGFPGTPVLTQGVTPHHGWAQTVNRPDLVDIYKLTVDDADTPRRYKLDGQWKEFERSTSKFRVKLWGPFSLPVTRDVLWSEHGPVLDTQTGFYAIRYSGMGHIAAVEQWYDMGKATSLAEWQAAIAENDILSFNMVYADRNGNIGTIYNAQMPRRIEGPDWTGVLPGNNSELIWDEFRPVSDMPQIYNPDCGWVFSANSTPFRVTDPACDNDRSDYSETFGIETRMTNRARQALALMTEDPQVSGPELLAYRADAAYHPQSNLMLMIDEISRMDFSGEPELQAAQQLLAGWDGAAETDSRAAALAILTGMKAMGYEFVEELMDFAPALRETISEMNAVYGRIDPPWGQVNRIRRGETDLPLRGGPDTLRAIYGDREGFTKKEALVALAGDTHIMVADWDEDGELTLRSIHQFGAATLDEASPHYDDQAALFARGEYKLMPMTLEEVLPKASRDYRPGQ